MIEPSSSHYGTLGVERTATPDEIKRAYFRLVRVHSPESDAERFQQISAAYAVLSDPIARKHYDSDAPIPPGVLSVLNRAHELVTTDPAFAVAEAKRVLSVRNVAHRARFEAAVICLRAGQPQEALPITKGLIREAGQIVDYQLIHGAALRDCGELVAAQEVMERAVALGPWHVGAVLSLAAIHTSQGRGESAVGVLDRALSSGRLEPLEAVPLRIEKVSLLGRDRNWAAMEAEVAQVAAAVPAGDDDAACHVAAKWASLGAICDRAEAYDVAEFVFRAALNLADSPSVRGRMREIAPQAAAMRELFQAMNDPTVSAWVRASLRKVAEPPSSNPLAQRSPTPVAERPPTDAARAEREWTAFARRYPRVAARIQRPQTLTERRAARPRSSAGTGALGIVVLVLAGVLTKVLVREWMKPKPAAYPYTDISTPQTTYGSGSLKQLPNGALGDSYAGASVRSTLLRLGSPDIADVAAAKLTAEERRKLKLLGLSLCQMLAPNPADKAFQERLKARLLELKEMDQWTR